MVNPSSAARNLLWEHLDQNQRVFFNNSNRFYCQGNKSGDLYVVTAGFVYRIRDGHRFCVGLKDKQIPLYDEILAKKILIECDERRFLKVAIDHDSTLALTLLRVFRAPLIGIAVGFVGNVVWPLLISKLLVLLRLIR